MIIIFRTCLFGRYRLIFILHLVFALKCISQNWSRHFCLSSAHRFLWKKNFTAELLLGVTLDRAFPFFLCHIGEALTSLYNIGEYRNWQVFPFLLVPMKIGAAWCRGLGEWSWRRRGHWFSQVRGQTRQAAIFLRLWLPRRKSRNLFMLFLVYVVTFANLCAKDSLKLIQYIQHPSPCKWSRKDMQK